jgi:transcriptional regulator with XRE-family HTH domain
MNERRNSDCASNAAFAARLKQLMDARELTQSALAAEIWGRVKNSEGLDIARGRDRISVWLRGKALPDDKQLAKLARILRVEPTDLMSETAGKA